MPAFSAFQSWIGLAVAVLVLSKVKALNEPLRLTLLLVIVYVVLMNIDQLSPQVERFTSSLNSAVRPSPR